MNLFCHHTQSLIDCFEICRAQAFELFFWYYEIRQMRAQLWNWVLGFWPWYELNSITLQWQSLMTWYESRLNLKRTKNKRTNKSNQKLTERLVSCRIFILLILLFIHEADDLGNWHWAGVAEIMSIWWTQCFFFRC